MTVLKSYNCYITSAINKALRIFYRKITLFGPLKSSSLKQK